MVRDIEDATDAPPKHRVSKSPALSFPLNYLRIVYEFTVTVVCLPFHFLYFAVLPKKRWRRSWTLLEAALMPAVRRIMGAFDRCGFKVSGRNTFAEPNATWLKLRYGARFEWVEPLEQGLMSGVVRDSMTERTRVGLFSWSRQAGGGQLSRQDGDLVGVYLHGGGVALSQTIVPHRTTNAG